MDIGLWYSGGSIHLIRLLNLCLAIFWSNNRASFWRNADSNFGKIVAPNSPYRNCYSNEKKEGCQLSRIRAKFETKSKLSGATFLSDTQCTPTFLLRHFSNPSLNKQEDRHSTRAHTSSFRLVDTRLSRESWPRSWSGRGRKRRRSSVKLWWWNGWWCMHFL